MCVEMCVGMCVDMCADMCVVSLVDPLALLTVIKQVTHV